MKALSKIAQIIRDSDYRFDVLDTLELMNWMSDEKYIKKKFKVKMKKELNLNNPKTFNEKLQWLKLYDRDPKYSLMVDKCEVKKYVAALIGKEYIIPTYGVWDKFKEIDFEKLPNQFVLKCTHDSGSYVICEEKEHLNIRLTKKKIENALNKSFFYYGREWPYKKVGPRIIAEKYISDLATEDLYDYKFFCFNGKVKCYKIDFNRQISHRANYFDENGKLLPFGEFVCPPDYNRIFSTGEEIKTMISLAEKLSETIPFVRVDFYYSNGSIYFGEMTFYPASGWGPFIPEIGDNLLGDWLCLPGKTEDKL